MDPRDAPALPRVPAIAVHREEVPRFHFHNGLWMILTDGPATGGDLACLEAIFPRGGTLPRRIHTREDEFYYVLAGQIVVSVGEDAPKVAAEGAFVFVPRGVVREVRVISDVARIYQCLIPAGFETVIQRYGEPTQALAVPELAASDAVHLDALAWEPTGVTLVG